MTRGLDTWDPAGPGVLRLPSGRLVRGRALSRALPAGPAPDFALYLLAGPPPPVPWEARWVAFVRQRYEPRAVETLWQRRYVARFPPLPPGSGMP